MANKKWMVAAKRADFQGLSRELSLDQVTVRCLRNRDLTTADEMKRFLYGSFEQLYDGAGMKDMDRALEILENKLASKAPIRIIGDYDADGIMSAFILYTGLTRLGGRVDYRIPDRMKDGYGMHEGMVTEAESDGIDTMITCDNGIAAAAAVALARETGMTVIVTDHHEVPLAEDNMTQVLPDAHAVVDPHREDCTYPFKGLCGAGVAFKLVEQLYKRAGISAGEIRGLLPFAAIATVTDVMDLKDENRILVKEGLKELHRISNIGLLALLRVNGIEREQLTNYHLGFVIGPCLNASGRLHTALMALELLLCTDPVRAEALAQELKELNISRKAMTQEGLVKALELIETTALKEDPVLVVYLPDCHESVAGIIAGRIREVYYKPVFVVTKGKEGIKGSGRSIESYSMFQKLCECREYLTKFGGHPMAAGLSLKEEDLEAFRRALNENCGLTREDLIETVTIDVPMPMSYVSYRLIEELALLEPFGKGNKKPVFAQKGVVMKDIRILGKDRNFLKATLITPEGCHATGVYFGEVQKLAAYAASHETMSMLYYPELNTYNGNTTIQMKIIDWR